MSRYILIHRLRWPLFLLLVGVLALLAQVDVVGWEQSWPVLLIGLGVLLLAERVALAAEGYPLFPGAPYSGANQDTGQSAPQTASTSIVPSPKHDFENHLDGGER
jgi:hypothetical protein